MFPVSWLGLIFAVSYSKPALDGHHKEKVSVYASDKSAMSLSFSRNQLFFSHRYCEQKQQMTADFFKI